MGLTQLYGLSPSYLCQNQPRIKWVKINPKVLGWCRPNKFSPFGLGRTQPSYFSLGQN